MEFRDLDAILSWHQIPVLDRLPRSETIKKSSGFPELFSFLGLLRRFGLMADRFRENIDDHHPAKDQSKADQGRQVEFLVEH